MKSVVRQISLWTLTALAVLAITGCSGYQLGDVKPSVYQNIDRLHVPTFENDTLEPRTAVIVTNAVIKQLQQDGTYTISSKDSADAVLRGRITRIERRQLRAAETDTLKTTEMSLYIVVQWYLQDPATGDKLAYAEGRDLDVGRVDSASDLTHRPGRVVGQTVQFLDPNFQLSERNAIPFAAEDLAEKLAAQLTTGF